MRFTGEPQPLRNWAAAHGRPQLPDDQAALFLQGSPGEVFGASTASGKHALISFDDGACEVIALSDDPATVQQQLLTTLQGLGVSVTPMGTRAKPDGSSTQYLFDATLAARRWVISLTAKPHDDAPGLAPEVRLISTAG